jgi:hypothetical protein
MPALITHVSIDLYKLFENRATAPDALCRKAGRVMEMTVDVSLMFVVRVLRSKKGWTNGTREMFDVELLACGRD